MRILLTGASGFIGSYVKKQLEGIGDINVYSPTRFELNININSSVKNYISDINPDVIFHIAGISDPQSAEVNEIYESNALSVLRILSVIEALPFKNGPKTLLYASAGYVYGPSNNSNKLVLETDTLRPESNYAKSKLCGEIISGASGHNIRKIHARIFNAIGIGHPSKYVVPKIVKSFANRDSSLNLINTDSVRDFIDVRDVANALIVLALNRNIDGAYNICSGKGHSIEDVLMLMEIISNHKMVIKTSENMLRSSDNKFLVGSNEKLLLTGWRQRYTLKDSLSWMYDSYKTSS